MSTRTMPLAGDYAAAVQNPAFCFSDPVLRASVIERNAIGQPRAVSGQFSVVFPMTSRDGQRHGVKCFTHDAPYQLHRYELINDGLAALRPRWATDFTFQPRGIKVEGETFPILRMDWIEGTTLLGWLESGQRDADAIGRLADEFDLLMRELSDAGIAHGDLQHGNILVEPDGGLRLIDYDGIYLPGIGLEQYPSHETGLPGYQPPGRTAADYGPLTDRFSARLISLSLRALAADPGLLDALNPARGEYLLLDRDDFADPGGSARLSLLAASPDLPARELAAGVRTLVTLPPDRIPAPGAPLPEADPQAPAPKSSTAVPAKPAPREMTKGESVGCLVAVILTMVVFVVIIAAVSATQPPQPKKVHPVNELPVGIDFPLSDGQMFGMGKDGSVSLLDSSDYLRWSAQTDFSLSTANTAPYATPQVSGDCVTVFNGAGGAEIVQAARRTYRTLTGVGYAVVDGSRAAWSDGTIRDACTGKVLATASPHDLAASPPECLVGSIVIRQQGTWRAPAGLRAWRGMKQLWQRSGRLGAVCDGAGTTAVLNDENNTVDLVNPATGKPSWPSPESACTAIPGVPAVCATGSAYPVTVTETPGVVVVSGNGVVVAFDKVTGKPLWQQAGGCALATRASPQAEVLLGPCAHVADTGYGNDIDVTAVDAASGTTIKSLYTQKYDQWSANGHEVLGVDSFGGFYEMRW